MCQAVVVEGLGDGGKWGGASPEDQGLEILRAWV